MDLMTFLGRLEAEFFRRLDRKTGWGKKEVKAEFTESIKNVLITTYTRIKVDADAQTQADGLEGSNILARSREDWKKDDS